MSQHIKRLIKTVPTCSADEPGKVVHAFFEQDEKVEGVVVLEGDRPVGLVMRNDFYQKMGSQYGHAIFMKRPIHLLMSKEMLSVDAEIEVSQVGILAMNRSREHIYDFVVVVDKEKYIGVVSIKLFLIELSKVREREIELLKEQQEILEKSNEAEKKYRLAMEEKNMQLRAKNISIRMLLDHAGQGFLSFGPDLCIDQEYSLQCIEIFGEPISGKCFIDLIASVVEEEMKKIFYEVFRQVLSGQSKVKESVFLSLLPEEIKLCNKHIHMDYKVINGFNEKRIMVILTDITEKKHLEEKMQEEKRHLKLIVKAATSPMDIAMAVEDFRQFHAKAVAKLEKEKDHVFDTLSEIYRTIHTYKGDFAQLHMHAAANALHQIEDESLEVMGKKMTCTYSQVLDLLNRIKVDDIIKKDIQIIEKALGKGFCDTSILKGIETKINVKDVLQRFEENVKNLAMRMGKSVKPMVITGRDILLDRCTYSDFFKSLVHLFRNCIDHGLETPEERLVSNKDSEGCITCEVIQTDEKTFALKIMDDGRGIDAEKLFLKAVEKGIYTEEQKDQLTQQQKMELMFMDDLSTKEEVTLISGRGMGLPAVRQAVEALGGIIEVESKPGEGTSFLIRNIMIIQ